MKLFGKLFSRNFILYTIIGLSGVALDFIFFAIFTKVFGIEPLIANIISTTIGITNNFILNTLYNFKKRDVLLVRFLSFYAVGIVGIILSTIIIRALHDGLHFDPLIAKFVSLFFVLIAQYKLNKIISFRSISSTPSAKKLLPKIKPFIPDIFLYALLFIALALASAYLPSTDETANLLESKLILEGKIPYENFFTHHMPGIYLISVPLYLLSLDNVYLFRLLFELVLFAWICINSVLIRRVYSPATARTYLLLTALGLAVFWAHLGLAESIIACALTTLFVVFSKLSSQGSPLSRQDILIVTLLLSFIAMLAIAYVFVIVVAYLLLAFLYFTKNKPSLKELGITSLIISAPYLLLAIVLISTGSLSEFVFDNLTFNSQYYSHFFKDIGSSPLEVLVNSTLISLESILKLFTQPYLPAISLFAAYVVLVILLIRSGKLLLALFVASLIFLLNPRGDSFGPHGITAHFDNITQHSTVYHMMGLLFMAVVMQYINPARLLLAVRKRSLNTSSVLTMLALVMLGIIGTALVRNDLRIYKETYREAPSSNLYNRQRSLPYPYVNTVNEILSRNDTAWIGPFDFESQLLIKAEVATPYTFYAPWHAACKSCTDDFIEELSAEKPKIVYWEEKFTIAGQSAEQYAPQVSQLFSRSYFTVPDKRLDNFYFLEASRSELTNALRAKGYQVE